MNVIVPLTMASFGFSFIYLSWKSLDGETKWLTSIGWALVLSSTVLLIAAEGLEFGVAYAFFGLTLLPLCIAIINSDIRKSTTSTRPRKSHSIHSMKNGFLSNAGNFVIVVPTSCVFSLLVALYASGVMGLSEVNRLTVIVLGFPILWGIMATLYLYRQSKKTFAGVLVFATLILSGITIA